MDVGQVARGWRGAGRGGVPERLLRAGDERLANIRKGIASLSVAWAGGAGRCTSPSALSTPLFRLAEHRAPPALFARGR